jgi:hypothetical protein
MEKLIPYAGPSTPPRREGPGVLRVVAIVATGLWFGFIFVGVVLLVLYMAFWRYMPNF